MDRTVLREILNAPTRFVKSRILRYIRIGVLVGLVDAIVRHVCHGMLQKGFIALVRIAHDTPFLSDARPSPRFCIFSSS
jgi:hypothetical protein